MVRSWFLHFKELIEAQFMLLGTSDSDTSLCAACSASLQYILLHILPVCSDPFPLCIAKN
uniref:Uncharacterized protein n=1 Tax=Rhizophora mucronata TaxID=61149 RepID=A0A2P2N4D2_RHIMU